jgi:hypothetical protein
MVGAPMDTHNTREMPMVLCPDCAVRRRNLPRFVFLSIFLTVAALAVIGYFLKW